MQQLGNALAAAGQCPNGSRTKDLQQLGNELAGWGCIPHNNAPPIRVLRKISANTLLNNETSTESSAHDARMGTT